MGAGEMLCFTRTQHDPVVPHLPPLSFTTGMTRRTGAGSSSRRSTCSRAIISSIPKPNAGSRTCCKPRVSGSISTTLPRNPPVTM